MLDALIMTLGFEPGPLVSSLASHAAEGFTPKAKIIVLTPNFPDERAERAWRQLQNIFDMMKLGELEVSLRRYTIDLSDFSKAVQQIKSLLSEFKDKRIQISLTGGMRALILATFTAYLLTEWREAPKIEVSLEGRGIMLKVPNIASILTPLINERKAALLRIMSPGRVYRSGELWRLFGRDRSTLYRYLRTLCELGLIERVDRGFRLTRLGELLSEKSQ